MEFGAKSSSRSWCFNCRRRGSAVLRQKCECADSDLSVPDNGYAGRGIVPDISPDGNYIAFTRNNGEEQDIFLQRIGGGNPINLTKDSHSKNNYAAFSPNGDQIAFCSDRDGGGIYLMGSTGESVRRLTKTGYNPAWSPDGKKIAYTTEGIRIAQARTTFSQLWSVSLQDGSTTLIDSGDAVQPHWSPHGNRIVYWGLPHGSGWRDLWSIDIDRKNKVRLTNDPAIDWNPLSGRPTAVLFIF